jgi:P2 family phage contractile tail tube protein
MKLEVNKLTNATVWVDGKNYFGKIEEVNLPVPKYKMATHKALGLIAEMEYFSGLDKMEAKLKMNAPYKDYLRYMGDPTRKYNIMLRGSLQNYQGSTVVNETPYVATMVISPKDYPLGNFKQNDNVELENNFTVYYVKLEIGGEKMYEVDVENNILYAGGRDVLTSYRTNLGL